MRAVATSSPSTSLSTGPLPVIVCAVAGKTLQAAVDASRLLASRLGITAKGSAAADVFGCASDPTTDHLSNYDGRPPYPFSYSMNCYITDNGRAYANMNITPAKNFRISRVKNISRKILYIDE